ncbi:MAG TPA: hypothetical protein VMA77_26740 [Solirubrobacteraceae bacterium]|nr:hypothetical protein [Solirubrobacteraceae bacterium]
MTQFEHRHAESPGPQHGASTGFIDPRHQDVHAFAERAVAARSLGTDPAPVDDPAFSA